MRMPSSERGVDRLALLVLEALGHAHDIADRNAPPFLGEAIAAARTAHALQNAGAHQLLHHLFEITLRHALARGDFLGLHRFGPRIEGDVDHRFERQQGFAGEFQHGSGLLQPSWRPVEPKPPAPRALSDKFRALDKLGVFVAGDHHLGDLACRA